MNVAQLFSLRCGVGSYFIVRVLVAIAALACLLIAVPAAQAQSDVYYFGEDTDIFHPDGTATHDGSWIAGKNGVKPGIVMPGWFLLGARYFQEQAPGVAMDRAEHVEMGLMVATAAGTFQDCVFIVETTPLEPGATSEKTYCPGVGLVSDAPVQLIKIERRRDD